MTLMPDYNKLKQRNMSTNKNHNVPEKELDNLLNQAFLNLDFNNPKNQELMEAISNHTMNTEPVSTGLFNKSFFTRMIGVFAIVITAIVIYNRYTETASTVNKHVAVVNPTEPTPSASPEKVAQAQDNKPVEPKSILQEPTVIAAAKEETKNSPAYVDPKNNQAPGFDFPVEKNVNNEDSNYVFPKLTEKEIKATKKQKQAMAMWLVKPKGKYSPVSSGKSTYLSGNIKDTSSAFYMQNLEVTNLEYRTFLFDLLMQNRKEEFLTAKPYQNLWMDVSQLKHPEKMKDLYFSDKRFDDYPVLNITPEGAELYCKWLEEIGKTQGVGLKARLPYENEWTKAARAKLEKGNYTWGSDSMQNKKGCYLANFCIKKQSERLNPRIYCDPKKYPDAYTSAGLMLGDSVLPVSVFAYNPNNFGLYCMMGNAAEMVYDNKTKMVKTKGGSWNSDLDGCKISSEEALNGRIKANPMTGFRPIFKLVPTDNFGAMDRDDPETGLSTLTAEEMKTATKEKSKMINQLIKLNKDKYAYIPMGSFIYKKDTFSVQSFYIETTEVTNLEYRTFLADLLMQGRNSDYLAAKPDQMMWIKKFPYAYNEPMANMYFWHPAYDEYPVVNISRKGAQLYCDWLTIETNKVLKESNKPLMNDLRLPADLEWAYAASNGKYQAKYANGNTFLRNSKGAYEANYSCASLSDATYDSITKLYVPHFPKKGDDQGLKLIGDGLFHTGYVKSYYPNSYGLFCMAGNVAEMVSTYDVKNKVYLKTGTKGGSWFSTDHFLEIDAEEEYPGEAGASPLIGFRPVVTAPKK